MSEDEYEFGRSESVESAASPWREPIVIHAKRELLPQSQRREPADGEVSLQQTALEQRNEACEMKTRSASAVLRGGILALYFMAVSHIIPQTKHCCSINLPVFFCRIRKLESSFEGALREIEDLRTRVCRGIHGLALAWE